MRARVWMGLALALSACSGGGHSTPPPASSLQAALEAARACLMWRETTVLGAVKKPDYAQLNAMSGAIAQVANQASVDDAKWSQLALDVAGANDFQSVAIVDANHRIITDCKAVPADAAKAASAEKDPFTTTSTTPSTAPSTTPSSTP